MSREHAEAEVVALRPAFGMHADAGPILLGGALPERDVREAQGRHDEALAAELRALELEPFTLIMFRLLIGLMLLASLCVVCGLIMDAVTLARREAKRLAYLAISPFQSSATAGD